MVFDASVALTWILLLALFPMAFFWRRSAWRILVRREFSQVALKHGETSPDVARWAPYQMLINAVDGVMGACVLVWLVVAALPHRTWSAVAGSTNRCKFFASFPLSRYAYAGLGKKNT